MTQKLRNDSKSDSHNKPRLPENTKAMIAEEVRRRLESRGGSDSIYAEQELYAERKLREAFSTAPRVKSVAYTRKCDDWTLVITHDDEEKSDAMMRLMSKLCDISRADLRMPVFETWILHVEDAGGNIPSGEKSVVAR